MSSALRHLAFTPPSHLSFRLEGRTADRGERTGRALKYIAAGCGHMSPMSTGKLSAFTIITMLWIKTAALSPSPPDTNIGNKTQIVLVKNTN